MWDADPYDAFNMAEMVYTEAIYKMIPDARHWNDLSSVEQIPWVRGMQNALKWQHRSTKIERQAAKEKFDKGST